MASSGRPPVSALSLDLPKATLEKQPSSSAVKREAALQRSITQGNNKPVQTPTAPSSSKGTPDTSKLLGKGSGGPSGMTAAWSTKVQPLIEKDKEKDKDKDKEKDKAIEAVQRVVKGQEDLSYGVVSDDCFYEGMAKKEGGSVRNWKSRWFVLSHRHLLYYDCEEDDCPREHALPLGVISLEAVRDPEQIKELPADHRLTKLFKSSSLPFVVELPLVDDRDFHFRVKSHKECVTWCKLLQMQTYKLREVMASTERKDGKTNIPEGTPGNSETGFGMSSSMRMSSQSSSIPLSARTPKGSQNQLNPGSKMPPWFDEFDEHVASLPPVANPRELKRKDSDQLEQVRAQYSITRKNSFIYTEELRNMAKAETARLRELICLISAPYVLHDRLKDLQSFVRSSSTNPGDEEARAIAKALSPKCVPPEQLLEATQGYSLGVALAKPLEALVTELNQAILALGKHPIGRALRALSDYYQAEADRVNTLGSKAFAAPRVVITGIDAFLGQRLLHPNASAALLHHSRRDNKHGLHAVIAYGGIHWKRAPGWPGYEFAVDALNKLLTGTGSPPAQLLKITKHQASNESWCYQAATTVDGALLLDVLEQRPELLSRVDPENYSLMYLLGVLTNLQDGKPDNFIVRFNERSRLLEIVGIDNDHAFADTIVKTRDGHGLNVRHVLYFLPQSRQRIDATAREKFLTHTPEEIVLRWLEQLHRNNIDLAALREEGVLTRLDFTEMNLPICLRPGEAERLLRRMHEVRAALQADPNLSHHGLLQKIQPEVHLIVEKLLHTTRTDRPDQGYAAFRRLFAMPSLEKDDDLKELCSIDPIKRLINDPKSPAPGIHDYSRQRTQTIAEAVADLVATIDFAALGRKSRKIQDLLFRELIPTMALPHLTLRGSDRFNDYVFEAFMNSSKDSLRSLEIVDCNAIAPSVLRAMASFTLKPPLVVRRCAQITPEAFNMLRSAGVQIETKVGRLDSSSRIANLPTSSSDEGIAVPEKARALAAILEEATGAPSRFKDALTLLAKMEPTEITRSRTFIATQARASGVLHAAVHAGENALVKILVKGFGVDVNSWDVRTFTPLQVAAHKNDVAACKVLIELGADVNRKGAQMRTPLVEALLQKAEDVAMQLLVDYKGIVELPTTLPVPDGRTMLHAAIAGNMIRVAQHVLNNPSLSHAQLTQELHAVSRTEYNVLHYAAEGRVEDLAFLKTLLEKGVDPTHVAQGGITPLLSCAIKGHLVLAKLLLAYVSDVRSMATAVDHERRNVLHLSVHNLAGEDSSDRGAVTSFIDFMVLKFPELLEARDVLGRTPLAVAAKAGGSASVAVLLRHGASVHVADASGNTPLHHAASLETNNAVSVLQQLLGKCDAVTLKARNNRGLTPLGRCVMSMHLQPKLRRQMVKLFQDSGSKLNEAINPEVEATLLHYAVRIGANEAVQFLLTEAFFDSSLKDVRGWTALHVACTCGNVEAAKFLLAQPDSMTRLDERNLEGDTPLITAVKGSKSQANLVRLLLSKGAIEYYENDKGESVMDIAQRRNLRDVVAVLVDHVK